jgi:hypothetical protein
LREALAKVKALPAKPSFIIHTGDITHLSKPAEFDNADKVFGETGVQVPGSAPSPGPMLVPADQLRTKLGLSTVTVVQGNKPLAIVDKTLAG